MFDCGISEYTLSMLISVSLTMFLFKKFLNQILKSHCLWLITLSLANLAFFYSQVFFLVLIGKNVLFFLSAKRKKYCRT